MSLNRQQYLGSLNFSFYAVPILEAVSPSSGPVQGGTALAISGAHLPLGDNYTCRFGDDASRWTLVRAALRGGGAARSEGVWL